MEQPPNPSGQQPNPFAPQPTQAPPQQPQAYPAPTPPQQPVPPQQPANPYGQPVQQPVDPYSAPQASSAQPVNIQGGMALTPMALMSVLGTQVWVKIISIVFLVLTGIQLISMLFIGAKGAKLMLSGGAELLVVYLIPIVIMGAYIFMAVRLLQYGTAIGRLRSSKSSGDFEKAMQMHSAFWKILGILCIVMIALYIIAVVVIASSASAYSRF